MWNSFIVTDCNVALRTPETRILEHVWRISQRDPSRRVANFIDVQLNRHFQMIFECQYTYEQVVPVHKFSTCLSSMLRESVVSGEGRREVASWEKQQRHTKCICTYCLGCIVLYKLLYTMGPEQDWFARIILQVAEHVVLTEALVNVRSKPCKVNH